jgi:VWFA-related protein
MTLISRAVLILAAGVSSLVVPAAVSQEARFKDELLVIRIITEVRVVDRRGDPILGLEAGDFRATVGGVEVEVEAAEWIAGPPSPSPLVTVPGLPESRSLAESHPLDPRRGRLIVIFVQKDFESARLSGLYRMSFYARDFVESLAPEDRAALVVFGSHLQIHSDFTSDFAALTEKLTVPALFRDEQCTEQLSLPSLAEHFSVEEARDAANISQALAVLGEALEPIPGPKNVVLFGWGIGRFTGRTVWLGEDYRDARQALASSRSTVFSLDVTTADYHTLEVGLKAVAADTGGFYAKTHLFPELAVQRLARVISGYYELSLIAPGDMLGYYEVEVTVPERRQITVLTRPVVSIGLEDFELGSW